MVILGKKHEDAEGVSHVASDSSLEEVISAQAVVQGMPALSRVN